ncbi:phospholipase A2 [Nocardia brasiliensis]|uniref:phospholipase A2 n=1 Tax=Nocardia brasiliensis TaxID=37326 RepID=UPI00245377D7|nr:phospholipase A2 [Nocardia brasiliensis]
MRIRDVALVCLTFPAALLLTSGYAAATPTPEYPLDPPAEPASKVYPGDPVPQSRSMATAFVGVPSDYVYNTKLKPVARHDYCTSAPDSYFAADFRGPCARHDMCYDRADAAGTDYTACNSALRTDMITNCSYAYGTSGTALQTCKATAEIYWAAVTVTHLD